MIARASVRAEADGDGGTRLVGLRSEAPVVLRATAHAVYLVGGAGGPLGGDDLTLEIDVGPGAELTVRTAAAAVALPGPTPSQVRVRARVACGGRLRWRPEPTVAARGCRHVVDAMVVLEDGAGLVWREEVVLGRWAEPAGSVVTRMAVDLGGAPLLRHELALGPAHPGSGSPAVAGEARAAGSMVVVEPAWRLAPPPPSVLGATAAALPLAGPGLHIVALAPDIVSLRALLDAGFTEPSAPGRPEPAREAAAG